MNRAWRHGLLTLPGVGISMLPKLVCPACWPAYAGLLSSFGLGFLVPTHYLLPLTASFLFFAVLALAFRASKRRGYGPCLLGVGATAGILLGKFVWASDNAVYSAVGILLASLWNAWPRQAKHREAVTCPECQERESSAVRFERAG